MPAPRHIRITFRGIWGLKTAATEEWNFGLSAILTPSGDPDNAVLAGHATHASTLWQSNIASRCGSAARLTEVEYAVVGADGKYERNAAGAYKRGLADVDITSTGTDNLPLSVSVVATLESSYAGPTGRGRFYLPTPVLGTLTRGSMATTARDNLLTGCKGLVDGLNTRHEFGVDPPIGRICVASGGSPTKGLAPALHPVSKVSMGLVPDTQRRRRGDLLENRVALAVA